MCSTDLMALVATATAATDMAMTISTDTQATATDAPTGVGATAGITADTADATSITIIKICQKYYGPPKGAAPTIFAILRFS